MLNRFSLQSEKSGINFIRTESRTDSEYIQLSA